MCLNSLEQWDVMGAVIERQLTSGRVLSEGSSWWYPNRKIAIYILYLGGADLVSLIGRKPSTRSNKRTLLRPCHSYSVNRLRPYIRLILWVCSTCADALASTWSILLFILRRNILLWTPTHKQVRKKAKLYHCPSCARIMKCAKADCDLLASLNLERRKFCT